MTAPRPLTPAEVDKIECGFAAVQTPEELSWGALDSIDDLIETIRLQAAEITRLQSDVAELMQAANEQAGQVARLEEALNECNRIACDWDGPVMKAWDSARASVVAGNLGSWPRDILESALSEIDDVVVAALNPSPEKT